MVQYAAKLCVGVARTCLPDAPLSLFPRSGTASSVFIVDIAICYPKRQQIAIAYSS
ncbi:hypothetical protein GNF10_01900 [Nostoc sp. UCD121]|uniref:hypothetical protein n=1 Tax=Nostoc sp. UCD121 TaxID=2681305 RepID=UPI001623C67E|nr:hypothetical protein [Nostoc sp. UCD121]MBC1274766.1 hypothetical protein [Nostoc sp. UCD121]MBC1297179.1 hypothetical protein [Nostoc sp. UCD122]